MLVPKIKHNDWRSIQLAIEKLASIRLGPETTPTFAGLTLTGLTASRLLSSDADKQLASSDLASWVTETTNQVLVADDGDGTITLSAPQDIDIAADVQFASLTLNNTGLHLLDTNASHDLIIAPGSDLTVDRTLTITTGDSDRTITLSGNPTLADWFDQSVKQAASPTFANLSLGTGELTCGSINRAAGSLTLEIAGVPQVTITDTTVTYAGDVVITGTATYSSNIIIPDAGWIGSIGTNQAIQIQNDGDVDLNYNLSVADDITVEGHIIFPIDNSHIGYVDNSPMLVFNNTDDRIEATGGLTVSLAASVAGNIESTAGELRSGVQDTTRGYCRLFGQGAAQVWGGTLYLETSADYDAAIAAYILSAYEDDFIIQNGGGSNLFHIAGADNSVNVANALNVTGAITAANYTAANLLTACATNAGTLDFSAASKTLTVENNAIVSQDYSVDASPTFSALTVSNDITIGNDKKISSALNITIEAGDAVIFKAHDNIKFQASGNVNGYLNLVTVAGNPIFSIGGISAGETIVFNDDVKYTSKLFLSPGTQDYLFTKLGYATTQLVLRSQTAGEPCNLHFFGKTGDGSEDMTIRFWAKSTPVSYTNYESFAFGYISGETPRYELYSAQHGTGEGAGVVRPIHIWTKGNANQMVFQNDGDIEIGAGPLDFTLTMGNSTKDPATEAPADWVEVKINGTTYYIPAYAAS